MCTVPDCVHGESFSRWRIVYRRVESVFQRAKATEWTVDSLMELLGMHCTGLGELGRASSVITVRS